MSRLGAIAAWTWVGAATIAYLRQFADLAPALLGLLSR